MDCPVMGEVHGWTIDGATLIFLKGILVYPRNVPFSIGLVWSKETVSTTQQFTNIKEKAKVKYSRKINIIKVHIKDKQVGRRMVKDQTSASNIICL